MARVSSISHLIILLFDVYGAAANYVDREYKQELLCYHCSLSGQHGAQVFEDNAVLSELDYSTSDLVRYLVQLLLEHSYALLRCCLALSQGFYGFRSHLDSSRALF
ncbi:hypothetical protein GGF38_000209 [Coemansia sp. RSA 25]|nr:hypothetical protein GGF38_000209 [Coemansia sp. RSA 25]